MTGLVLKDLLMMRKTLKTYMFFFAAYLAMSVVGIFPISFATSIITLIITILPISAFSYDEMAKWDRYAASLPLGRRKIVGARYLFILLLILLAAAFGLAATVISSIIEEGNMLEMLLTMLVILTYGLALNDIVIPLTYKLGPERSRSYLYIIIFAPMVLFFLALRLELLDLSVFNAIPEETVILFCGMLPIAGLAGLGLSYLLSCHIYEKKEF